jgi:hypothetical protein
MPMANPADHQLTEEQRELILSRIRGKFNNEAYVALLRLYRDRFGHGISRKVVRSLLQQRQEESSQDFVACQASGNGHRRKQGLATRRTSRQISCCVR